MTAPLPLEEAQARLLALAIPLPVEQVAVEQALGRFLAAPLIAIRTQPAADLSAMDGYAVRAADGSGPWRVVGESAAGHPYAATVQAGEAVRIATGAMMPTGADTVIVQEDVQRDGENLLLTGELPTPKSKHIRKLGQDFTTGQELLPSGTPIGPPQIALALAAGHSHLPVRHLPKVVIIDSGDELAMPGTPCPPHQIPASNGAMLAALCAHIPCHVQRIGPVPDDADALRQALEQAAGADVVVTSGGASVGGHDLIRPALAAWGAELDFWRVAIKPGKPLLVARKGAQLVLGLPGNPVSSYVTASLFLLPLLRAISGAETPLPRHITMRLAAPLPAGGNRREFLRASFHTEGVIAQNQQDSGAMAALAKADLLIDRPAKANPAATGDDVLVLIL